MTSGEKEQVIFSTKPSFTLLYTRIFGAFLTVIICGFLLSFISTDFLLIPIAIVLLAAITASAYGIATYQTSKYILTTKRLIIEQGILGKSRRTMAVHRFQDVPFNQTFTERIFDIGDILIESAGEMGTFKIKEIGNFSKRREQISKLIDYG
jgi:uncharacterized membrane protein YdbT with pleckstrin-like domain